MISYPLEKLEDRLRATSLGRQIADVFEEHVEEIMMLINNDRQVKVTWHRNHGPEFIGSAVRSGFENDFQVLREIEGVRLDQLMRRMAVALQDKATPPLRLTIGKYFGLVMDWARRFSSLNEVLAEIDRMDGISNN